MAKFLSVIAIGIQASFLLLAGEPIRLHPENPHYFLFRDRPAALITAGEHYGAVLNLDFDYLKYLDVLQSNRFNLTRIFSGSYREIPGSFNIKGNTLAPRPGRFMCPWKRTDTGNASDADPKFDLTRWDDAYFARLKDFVAEAGKRGVVVELVLFCTMYSQELWEASPMNARNNINNIGKVGRYDVYAGKEKELLGVQLALTQKIVRELNSFDNVYFEICNEPYERGGLTKEWNDAVVASIVDAEKQLPNKHLIAQGFPSGKLKDVNPNVSVLNFHAAKTDDVRLNYDLNKVIAFDESGGSDQSDRKYRGEAWEFLLAGGAVYDHLDFSFTTDQPDGNAVPLPPGTPGGGGPKLRKQLQILKEFLETFEFIRMRPRPDLLQNISLTPASGEFARGKESVELLAEEGKGYAMYIKGGTQAEISLILPQGKWTSEWLNTKTGAREWRAKFTHPGGEHTLKSGTYTEDIALSIKLE